MKATEIKGRAVQPEGGGPTTGTVSDLVLDMDERRVVAFHVNRLENVELYVLDIGDVVNLANGAVIARKDAVLLPQEDASRYDVLPTLGRMLEQKAMTEGGMVLGKVVDLDIDPARWTISGYDITGNLTEDFYQGETQLSPEQVLAAGANMLLVSEPGAPGSEPHG